MKAALQASRSGQTYPGDEFGASHFLAARRRHAVVGTGGVVLQRVPSQGGSGGRRRSGLLLGMTAAHAGHAAQAAGASTTTAGPMQGGAEPHDALRGTPSKLHLHRQSWVSWGRLDRGREGLQTQAGRHAAWRGTLAMMVSRHREGLATHFGSTTACGTGFLCRRRRCLTQQGQCICEATGREAGSGVHGSVGCSQALQGQASLLR